MTDKEFDRLLLESVRTYGHEYSVTPIHSDAAVTPLSESSVKENIPADIPAHEFPPHFLDDISLTQKSEKKPVIHLIRWVSVAAAVIVLGTLIVLLPVLTGHVPVQKNETAVSYSLSGNTKEALPEVSQDMNNDIAAEDIAAEADSLPEKAADTKEAEPYRNHQNSQIQEGIVNHDAMPDSTDSIRNGSENIPDFTITAFAQNQPLTLTEEAKQSYYQYAVSVLHNGKSLDQDPSDELIGQIKTSGLYLTITLPEPTMIEGYRIQQIILAVNSTDSYAIFDNNDSDPPLHLVYQSEVTVTGPETGSSFQTDR